MIWYLSLIFVLSGAAGLIYESVWTRYLGLFVGHDAYAQVLVLVIFLGGMAGGAMAMGRRSERLADPLRWYVGVELVVGVIGLVFHEAYAAITAAAYDTLFPALAGSWLLAPAKWAIAGALILPQSLLLGMTFPLMSAGLLRRVGRTPGRIVSLLYFTNSFGAAVGVLVAGFYLVSAAGLPGTLTAAAAINLFVALAALLVAKWYECPRPDASVASAASGEIATAPVTVPVRLLLAVSFGTAVASFLYEIGWIRMLSLVLGSATHSFELMLSAFILGLSLGALWVQSRADHFPSPLRALGIVQWAMGTLALVTLVLYGAAFDWVAGLMQTFAPSDGGYLGFTFARYAICLAIMLPATFCAGMTLPLITRLLLTGGLGERAIGAVYGWNTLGSIVGAAAAGLLLLPLIGLKGVLVAGATIDLALGVWILSAASRTEPSARRLVLAAAPAMAGAVVVTLVAVRLDQRMLGSGVYRSGNVEAATESEVLYYRDGRTATVSVKRGTRNQFRTIATNGKPDASLGPEWFQRCDAAPRKPLRGDASTQALSPLVALAHVPRARTAAVIGHGSGMSSHFLLGSPHIREVVTIEIEPAMIEGARAFYPANRRVYDDPRAHFVIDDAKSYFAASDRQFDLIVSEPSNPWVSGVAGLFTTEFYGRVRRYLSDEGIFAQWIHVYEIDDDLVLSVLAALHRSFPAYDMFMTSGGDLLIVASKRPQLPPPDWSVMQLPTIATDLCAFLPMTPQTLEATRSGSRAVFAPLLDGAIAAGNSDFYPVLDLGAERTRFLRRHATGFGGLFNGRFDLTAPIAGRRLAPGDEVRPAIPEIPRLGSLALGAALRHTGPRLEDTTQEGFAVALAAQRRDSWERSLDVGAPASWRSWFAQLSLVEHEMHGGTAGVANEGFFSRASAFAERHDAPEDVRAGIAFLHGLRAWDFKAAAKAADRVLPAVLARQLSFDPDEFRDGAVLAKLSIGAAGDARRLMDTLRTVSNRRPDDVRVRLLDAYVRAAEDGARAGIAAR